jgi:hypothetical protein
VRWRYWATPTWDLALVDLERGNHHALAVSECERVTHRKTVSNLVGNVEHHRQRPQNTAFKAHLGAHRSMLGCTEVMIEGRISPVDQELEVTELARAEFDRRPVARLFADLGRPSLVDQQIDQARTMRCDEVIQCSGSPALLYLQNRHTSAQRGIVTACGRSV